LFGAEFAPRLVVLVIVANDLANNSPVLEGLRNGWSPEHPPRFFLSMPSDTPRPIAIDPEWSKRRLAVPELPPTRLERAHAALRTSSYLYAWLFAHVAPQHPALAAQLVPPPARAIAARMPPMLAALGDPAALEGWRYPDDVDMDAMFYAADPLPPVFARALRETDAAIAELVRLGAARGFQVVALGSAGLRPSELRSGFGRTLDPEVGVRRWKAILARHGVPFIDQGAYAARSGIEARALRFHRDAHRSAEGHRVAAQATYDWFVGSGVCRGPR
jgi:hypothetical protein